VAAKQRILFFDVLRIAAISLVMLAHVLIYTGNTMQTVIEIPGIYRTTLGGLGVSLFLMVSGSVIAYNYRTFNTTGQVRDFILQRLARIYPAYWCSLFFAIGLNILYYLEYGDFHLDGLTLVDYLLSFSGFQAFFGQWGGRINEVGWFIGLIVCLYILYPVLSMAFDKNKSGTLLALFVISYLSWIVIQRYDPAGFYDMVRWMPLCNIFTFGLGIYIVKARIYPGITDHSRTIALLGDLSFYVFLIHLPLLYLLKINALLYIPAVMISSYVFLRLDVAIKTRLIAPMVATLRPLKAPSIKQRQ
jgi:peptidoglycan/LPS O-acetylase OafA/YrhL